MISSIILHVRASIFTKTEQEIAEMHILITLGRGYTSYVTHSEISDGIHSMEFVATDKSDRFSLQLPLMTH